MENIPTGYFIFIYAILALPYVIAVLGILSLLTAGILYFTNRRKAAIKILKVASIIAITFFVIAFLTQSSLGI